MPAEQNTQESVKKQAAAATATAVGKGEAKSEQGKPLPLEQWQEAIERQLAELKKKAAPAPPSEDTLNLSKRLAKIEHHLERLNGGPLE